MTDADLNLQVALKQGWIHEGDYQIRKPVFLKEGDKYISNLRTGEQKFTGYSTLVIKDSVTGEDIIPSVYAMCSVPKVDHHTLGQVWVYTPISDWSIGGPILDTYFNSIIPAILIKFSDKHFVEDHLKHLNNSDPLMKLDSYCSSSGDFLKQCMLAYIEN